MAGQGLRAQPAVVPKPTATGAGRDHHLAGFDLRSVASFAVRFFGCAMAILLAGLFVLWVLASVLGFVSAVEEFMDGVGFTDFHFASLEFLFGVVVLCVVLGGGFVAMTVIAAALYNVLAARSGGVRIFLTATADSRAGSPGSQGTARRPGRRPGPPRTAATAHPPKVA